MFKISFLLPVLFVIMFFVWNIGLTRTIGARHTLIMISVSKSKDEHLNEENIPELKVRSNLGVNIGRQSALSQC